MSASVDANLVAEFAEATATRLALLAPLPVVSTDLVGVMKMLTCNSKTAAFRELRALGVKPYLRGKYRINDIQNAVAKRSYASNAKRGSKKEPEAKPPCA